MGVGILKRLFGAGGQSDRDPDGIYFYVQCDNCGEKLRLRADKKYDLARDYETGALTWKKEIMDGRCFRIMYAHVVLDSQFRIQSQEIEGQGRFITEEDYRS
jgi:hypothetical protein